MPYSYDEYTASGGNATYAYTFDTIDPSHVKVKVAGVAATFTHDTAQSQITVTSSLTDGQLVRVYRDSSQGTRLVDYADGVAVGERSLDMDSRQAFYMSQEALDTANEAPEADPLFSQDTAGNVPGPTAADISNNFVLQADGDWVANAGGGGGGSGEINTASNVGAGTGAFAQKSGVDFQFKSLTGTSGLLSNTATEINIDAARASHSHSLSAITDLGNFSTSDDGLVPAPTAGDVTADRILQADGTWVDQTGGAGATSTQSLTDVQNTGATEGQALIYRTDEYVPETVLSTNLSVTPPAAGSVLASDGTNIVDITGGATGQVLKKIAASPGIEWADESAGSGTVQGIAGTGGGAALNDGISGTDVQVKSLTGGGGVTFNTDTSGEVRIDVNHDSIDGFVAGEHRVINDSGTSLTELWSASKASTELALKFDAADFNGDFDTRFSSKTLGGLNGVQSASVDSASDADTMVYSSANSRWEAQPGLAADLTGAADFDLFGYNNANSQWQSIEIDVADGTLERLRAWESPLSDPNTSRITFRVAAGGIAGSHIGAVDVDDLADADVGTTTAKGRGQLLTVNSSSDIINLPAGTNGHILVPNNSTANGVEWRAAVAADVSDFSTATDARVAAADLGDLADTTIASKGRGQLIIVNSSSDVINLPAGTNDHILVPNNAIANGVEWRARADSDITEGMVTQHAVALQTDSALLGTTFPGSPTEGQKFYRTDHNREYFYTGTKWLSTDLEVFHCGKASAAQGDYLEIGSASPGATDEGWFLPWDITIVAASINTGTAVTGLRYRIQRGATASVTSGDFGGQGGSETLDADLDASTTGGADKMRMLAVIVTGGPALNCVGTIYARRRAS